MSLGNTPVTISVVIPVYNAEKYLRQCIDSVVLQSFTDFELILVNDGSTDSSGAICDSCAAKDSRIKVIHKKNEGVSKARNLGIESAKGEYITFVDSDDEIHESLLQTLYDTMCREETDGVFAGITFVYEKAGERQSYPLPRENIKLFSGINQNYVEYHMNFGLSAIYSKLYKRKVLMENQIRFEEDYSIFEDCMFVTDYLNVCQNIFFVEQTPYYYWQRQGASLMKKFNRNAMDAISLLYQKEAQLRAALSGTALTYYYRSRLELMWRYTAQIYSRSNFGNKEKTALLREYISREEVVSVVTALRGCRELSNKDRLRCWLMRLDNEKKMDMVLRLLCCVRKYKKHE